MFLLFWRNAAGKIDQRSRKFSSFINMIAICLNGTTKSMSFTYFSYPLKKTKTNAFNKQACVVYICAIVDRN